jgi:hypothetical protein
LASKYWEISLEYPFLQSKQLTNFNNLINTGGLEVLIQNVTKIRSFGNKNIWSDTETSFVYEFVTEEEIRDVSVVSQQEIITIIPIGTKLDMGKSLKLNPYTKVWKIIQ